MTAVALNDLLADGQSNPGSGELIPLMQPLEHSEDFFEILRVNSQSVVFYRKVPLLAAVPGSGNVYSGDAGFLVLDSVADEILKQLGQLHIVSQDGGERIVRDYGTAFFDGTAQIRQSLLQSVFAGGFEQLSSLRSDARIGEQILNQTLHPAGPVDSERNELIGVGVQ